MLSSNNTMTGHVTCFCKHLRDHQEQQGNRDHLDLLDEGWVFSCLCVGLCVCVYNCDRLRLKCFKCASSGPLGETREGRKVRPERSEGELETTL